MTSKKNQSKLRWSAYFLRKGPEAEDFWKTYLSDKRSVLFIGGLGFDPRMNLGIEMLRKTGAKLDKFILIKYDEGPNSPSKSHQDLIEKNHDELMRLVEKEKIVEVLIKIWSDDGSVRVGSLNAARIFDWPSIEKYTDIIVDASAMPVGIFYPIVGKLLSLVDAARIERGVIHNLHLLAAENARLDDKISIEGLDEDAGYIYGFTGVIEAQAASDSPRIWIPLLGRGQTEQLKRILNLVIPEEVCPVFPMPSTNPRNVDDLMLEYREFLYDNLRVEPRNLVYSNEKNPFGLYRELGRTIIDYNTSLKPIGGCKVTISPLASKLLSIGAMLAAYEFKTMGSGVGIAHVEGQGYRLDASADVETERKRSEIYTVWLAGECYEHI